MSRLFVAVAIVMFCGTGFADPAESDKNKPVAEAPSKAECTTFEIKASNEQPGSIDGSLKPLQKKLEKPPFSSWKRFASLKQQNVSLEKTKQVMLDLVPGGKLSLLLRDTSQESGKKSRMRITFALDGKSGKRIVDGTMNLEAGDYWLTGGEPMGADATYILALTCK